MNLRPPVPISPDWLRVQDAFLREEAGARGVVDAQALPAVPVSYTHLDVYKRQADKSIIETGQI